MIDIKAIRVGLCVFGLAGVLAGPAQADYFVWKDPVHKVGASYPDRWERVYNQKSDDVLTIAAPGVSDFAGCKVRVRDEKRYSVYPARYGAANARSALDKTFWEEYLAENVAYTINEFHADAGLSRGFASYIQANYVSFDDPGQQKQSVAFASLYNNKIYVVECSSKISVFQKWYPQFMSVIKSVNFRKERHELVSGEYRPFMMDGPVWVRNGPNDPDVKRDMDLKKYW